MNSSAALANTRQNDDDETTSVTIERSDHDYFPTYRNRQIQMTATEIRQVRQLSPEESRQLWGWGDDIFGIGHLNLTYRPKTGDEIHFVLYADSRPVSHVGVLKHHARANGRSVLIGGIGGVVTIPAARRHGHAATLVKHATDFLREDWNVDFALLFCIERMRGYYERLGWRKVECEVLLDQPAGKVPSPLHVMTMSFNPEFAVIQSLELDSASW